MIVEAETHDGASTMLLSFEFRSALEGLTSVEPGVINGVCSVVESLVELFGKMRHILFGLHHV